MEVLLLEDDPLLNEIIEEFLLSKNYQVESFFDGEEAFDRIYEKKFELLILDVNVPSMDGFRLSKSLKESFIDIPTIFITSRHTSIDMQIGFKSGADDYIKKPFELSELSLRIENIKRLKKIESAHKVSLNDNITYDYSSKTIEAFENKYLLSKTEVKIFEYFLKNRNKVLSIDEICINNWIYDEMPLPTTIRTYIKNLRKMLGKEMITTIKGIGYKLNY